MWHSEAKVTKHLSDTLIYNMNYTSDVRHHSTVVKKASSVVGWTWNRV